MTLSPAPRQPARDPLQLALRLSVTLALGGAVFLAIGSFIVAGICFGLGLAFAAIAEVLRRRR